MATYQISVPGKGTYEVGGVDSEAAAWAAIQGQIGASLAEPVAQSWPDAIMSGAGNLAAGAAKGISNVGATLLTPVDALARMANAGQPVSVGGVQVLGQDRRAATDKMLAGMGADPNSGWYTGGKLAGEIGATAPVGGIVGGALKSAVPSLEALATAIASGGLKGQGLTRIAGGAASGGMTTGLADPEQAGTGAMLGTILPGAANVGRGMLGTVPESVQAMGRAAYDQGVRMPIDRIYQSANLDRLAGALEYLPFSGRGNTLETMQRQLQTAGARTMGQETSNITKATQQARTTLGPEFEDLIAKADIPDSPALRDALVMEKTRVIDDLGRRDAGPLVNKIGFLEDHLNKNGMIPGAAAIATKRSLDAQSKNPLRGQYARDTRSVLLEAVGQSLGPEDAARYAKVRQQWGSMREMEKIIARNADGDVSMARMGNIPQRVAPDLYQAADWASQFGRARSSPHSLAQASNIGFTGLGAWLASMGAAPAAAAVLGGGRLGNMAMNSETLRRSALGLPAEGLGKVLGTANQGLYRAAPLGLVELMESQRRER